MTKSTFLTGTVFLAFTLIFISCKKDKSEDTPADNSPLLSFMMGEDYISANTTLVENTVFKVGVVGSKNPNSGVDIAIFKVTREFNGITETVHKNNDLGEPYLSWESEQMTQNAEGQEKWTFSITDYSGLSKEISFIITTFREELPGIAFMQGVEFIFEDDSLPMSSIFKVGINAFSNQASNAKLSSFIVTRNFEHSNPDTVYEEDQIDDMLFTWQEDLMANTIQGNEVWSFTIEDESGYSNMVEFTITTVNQPYTPAFSPTYLIVNQGGVELLDFYITCTTDDWEMVKLVVSYPGGLGSEEYVGGGQIYTAGSPFTFTNYFPKLSGTWTFSILGYIKSGAHVNESFSAITSVVVTG